MKCSDLIPLIEDMKSNKIDKEHYCFHYKGFVFDVILSITYRGYEILIAVHTHNWGCVLNMNEYYNINIPDEVYFSLCKLLNLNWNINHFSSAVFLQLLSKNSPKKSQCLGVDYQVLRRFLPYRHVDEEDKIYFCGWNDHVKDKRKAHNFDKTEFFFGRSIADYCRKNNISSLWSDIPRNELNTTLPWEK